MSGETLSTYHYILKEIHVDQPTHVLLKNMEHFAVFGEVAGQTGVSGIEVVNHLLDALEKKTQAEIMQLPVIRLYEDRAGRDGRLITPVLTRLEERRNRETLAAEQGYILESNLREKNDPYRLQERLESILDDLGLDRGLTLEQRKDASKELRTFLSNLERKVTLKGREQDQVHIDALVPYFEQHYATEMNILRSLGMHPLEPKPMRNPFTKEMDAENWSNNGKHMTAGGAGLEELLAYVFDLPVDDPFVQEVVGNFLVHDGDKRIEKRFAQWADGLRKQGKTAEEIRALWLDILHEEGIAPEELPANYSVGAYALFDPILRREGYSPVVIKRISKGRLDTGHTSLKNLVELKDGTLRLRDVNAMSEEELRAFKVSASVHFMDDITFSDLDPNDPTIFMSAEDRMKARQFVMNYDFLSTSGLGWKNGKAEEVRDIYNADPEEYDFLITYEDLQRGVAPLLAAWFMEMKEQREGKRVLPENATAFEKERHLTEVITQRVQARIQAVQSNLVQ